MPPNQDGPSPELGRLLTELDELDAEFDSYYREAAARWQFWVGPVRVSRHVGSGTITQLYIAFCTVAFIAGVLVAALSKATELGVALVVGSIFAGGSFLSQVWVVQVQKEKALDSEIFGAERRRYLLGLLRHQARLAARIERIHPGHFDDE